MAAKITAFATWATNDQRRWPAATCYIVLLVAAIGLGSFVAIPNWVVLVASILAMLITLVVMVGLDNASPSAVVSLAIGMGVYCAEVRDLSGRVWWMLALTGAFLVLAIMRWGDPAASKLWWLITALFILLSVTVLAD